MRESRLMREKKERNLVALTERYYGKKDLLATWEEERLRRKGIENENSYLIDLARRVRGHKNDLAYRGADGFSESDALEKNTSKNNDAYL